MSLDLVKFAQTAISESWSRTAKSSGFPYNDYLYKIKNTSDVKLLSEMVGELQSFKGFGGAQLTGFQRRMISSASKQRMQALGYSR